MIVSAGGENVSSASYRMGVAVGIINWVINSTSYINKLGFFHLLLLSNDQQCTSANQCEGGYCCGGLCKSSACQADGAGGGSAGGGGSSTGGGGAAAGGGGGGGGAVPLPLESKEGGIKEFSVGPSSIKEQVELGGTKTKTITIRNTGQKELSLNLEISAINDFVFLSDSSFNLQPGEEKDVEVNIIGKKLGSYIGEIEIGADSLKKSVTLVVDVESGQALFDVKMDIPAAYKEVNIGDELKAQITLLNVGPARKVDVTATYIIKDKKGAIVHESSETFAVEKQASYVKSFAIPKDLTPGDYLAIVELRYGDSFAVSSELFKVTGKKAAFGKAIKSTAPLALVSIALVGFVLLFAYMLLPMKKFFRAFRKRK